MVFCSWSPRGTVCPAAGQGQKGKCQGPQEPVEQRQCGHDLSMQLLCAGQGRLQPSSGNGCLCATGVVSACQVSGVMDGRSLMTENMLVCFCHRGICQSHLGRGNLGWRVASVRLSCGRVCGTFSLFRIDLFFFIYIWMWLKEFTCITWAQVSVEARGHPELQVAGSKLHVGTGKWTWFFVRSLQDL